MFVSTSRFDPDALRNADEEGVLCVQFEDEIFVSKNDPENCLGKPRWLKQVNDRL